MENMKKPKEKKVDILRGKGRNYVAGAYCDHNCFIDIIRYFSRNVNG